MNWFQQNRFLGTFLVVLGISTIAALWFLLSARGSANEARAEFDSTAMELNRLQRLNPFPNDANLARMRTQAQEYSDRLEKLRTELKTRALPVEPMPPDQFQVRLRQAMATVGDRARANRVKLPENFYLGFDEYAAALPATDAAPLLAQELAQVELLVTMLIDARVEAITALRRVPAAPTPTPTPGPGRRPPAQTAAAEPPLVQRSAIEVAFLSGPVPLRRAINQIAAAQQQFYIIRTMHVLNERTEGPPRDATAAAAADAPTDDTTPAATTPAQAAAGKQALNFIVGNERLQTTARVELLRFTL
jgi:hypothetical protein